MSIVANRETINRPDEPYNDLPRLPPAGDIESKEVLKAAIEAHVALTDLRSAAKTLPDDGILVRAIALQEARLSSEIEMVVTTNDELYRALSQEAEPVDPQTKEVLRYGDAVWLGYNHLQKGSVIDVPFLQRLASVILKFEVKIREGRGTRIGDPRTGRVVYTPPIGRERIVGMLENLLEYWYAASGVDPLVRLCVIHYQFEAIHPFPDANGRVGRVLNTLFLVDQNLLDKPILYLSRAIIEDRARYYEGLRGVSEMGHWEAWVLYMLENLTITAIETRRRIEAIHQELEDAIEYAEANMRVGFSPALIRLVFSQPYTRISFLERAGIAKRQTASVYLQELERIGLLQGEKRGREMYYLNRSLFEILGL